LLGAGSLAGGCASLHPAIIAANATAPMTGRIFLDKNDTSIMTSGEFAK
jgi:hypothetical protein